MQIDWWTLGLQTVNFLVVVWLLSRFLYRPVRRIITEREAADRKAADDAAEKARQADATRQDYEAKRAALEAETRERKAALEAEMQKERADMLVEAKAEAEKMRAEAKDRLERDRRAALSHLQEEIAGLATSMARKALEAQPASAEDAIARAMARIDALSKTEIDDLTRDLDTEAAVLAVDSALPLPVEARGLWQAALEERFGQGIRVTFEQEPDLLGGHRLRFPHAVLDFSVAGSLERAAVLTEV